MISNAGRMQNQAFLSLKVILKILYNPFQTRKYKFLD